jgi:branched-chain amino acid transport system permease protein
VNALVTYGLTIATFFVIYNILTWGLNIQYGYAGIPDFTFITFMAAGAYITGVTTLPPSSQPLYVRYILGLHWPFPLPLLAGACAAAALGGLIGIVAFKRLRSDYLAIVTFSIGFIALDFVSNFVPLFNSFQGLSGVTQPLSDVLPVDYNTYQFVFLGIAAFIMLIMWFVANRLYNSPLGRTMRAIRENAEAAEALGKNAFRFRMTAFMVGCFFAGVGGALTIEYITAFNTSGWSAPETFIVWAALLVGGRGNNLGAIAGAFLVPIILFEVTAFFPITQQYPQLSSGLRLMLVGAILILVLWLRPQGIFPERKRFYEITLGAGGRT